MRLEGCHITTPCTGQTLLCPLHISRSDAPIGLRCSRRKIGTKPSDVASGRHSHWPNGAQCVHSRRLVPGSRTILYDSLVGMVKESYLLQLSVALYTFGSRWPPDEAPTADSGSGTHSHWPSRQHRGVGSANVKRASCSESQVTGSRLVGSNFSLDSWKKLSFVDVFFL